MSSKTYKSYIQKGRGRLKKTRFSVIDEDHFTLGFHGASRGRGRCWVAIKKSKRQWL